MPAWPDKVAPNMPLLHAWVKLAGFNNDNAFLIPVLYKTCLQRVTRNATDLTTARHDIYLSCTQPACEA